MNNYYKKQIEENLNLPVYFCGRLANYQYINQDEAILQGFNTARVILKDLKLKMKILVVMPFYNEEVYQKIIQKK